MLLLKTQEMKIVGGFKNIFSKRTVEDWLISAPHISYINFLIELVILSFVFHNMEITVKHENRPHF